MLLRAPYPDLEKAARKLLEITNATEAIREGRIYIEKLNSPFSIPGKPCDTSPAPS
jgi:hypothetical protein